MQKKLDFELYFIEKTAMNPDPNVKPAAYLFVFLLHVEPNGSKRYS